MKAVILAEYGEPELREVDRPVPADDQVLVRVMAAAVNPQDWYAMTGTPLLFRLGAGLRRPKDSALGTDFAGVVEAAGANVTQFQAGDEVFGIQSGAYAEYLCVRPRSIVAKPASVSFADAAAVPVAGLTALQALRDHGRLTDSGRVLVNGASGGVGTYAVQIAKALGAATVTGVCSTRNVDLVRSLGADKVIDYTAADFLATERDYDVLLDIAGSRPLTACKRVLAPRGVVVVIGGPKTNRLLGPLARFVKTVVVSRTTGMLAKPRSEDLALLAELLGSGRIRSVVEQTYPLADVREALRHLGTGHAQAKLVLTV